MARCDLWNNAQQDGNIFKGAFFTYSEILLNHESKVGWIICMHHYCLGFPTISYRSVMLLEKNNTMSKKKIC